MKQLKHASPNVTLECNALETRLCEFQAARVVENVSARGQPQAQVEQYQADVQIVQDAMLSFEAAHMTLVSSNDRVKATNEDLAAALSEADTEHAAAIKALNSEVTGAHEQHEQDLARPGLPSRSSAPSNSTPYVGL